MIFIYISNILYDNYKIYLDILINNYDIKLILFTNYENIKNIDTYNSINIFCDILDEYILKKITLLDNKCYLLNIKNLDIDDDYSYLKNYKINIINYNILYNNIINNYCKTFFLQVILDDKLIKKYNKIYDVAVININDKYKNNIISKLKNNNIIVNNIDNCKKEDSYNLLFKHKIFINFNDNNLFDEIICNYCIYNKIIIINCKKESYINISNLYKLNNYIMEISDNLLNNIIIYILNNYDKIYNDIYNNLNDELLNKLLNENKETCDTFFNNLNKKSINIDKIGFIILRHVNSEVTNKYWIECYNCIRKFYNDKIIIIDDNSDYNYISSDIELVNCDIIKSEIHGAGEILGYYYFHKFHYFEKAIILHDSVFINKYIDFSIFDNEKIKYLWHFTHDWDNEEEELALLNIFNNLELKKFYYEKDNWHGCYGLQSIIEYNFLDSIVKKYDLFILLKYLTNRSIRMNLERIFSVISTYEYNNLKDNPSIYGIIHHYIHWGYTFENYLNDKESYNKKKNKKKNKNENKNENENNNENKNENENNNNENNNSNNLDIIKVWTGR